MWRALIIGDLHIQNKHLQAFERASSFFVQTASTHEVTDVVLLGDILHFHAKVQAPALKQAVDFVRTLASTVRRVTILVGNHDFWSNQDTCSDRHWMGVFNDPKIQVVDRPMEWKTDPRVLCMPYTPPGSFEVVASNHGVSLNTFEFCFAHQEFKGASLYPSVWSEHGDPVPNKIQILSGHVHSYHSPSPGLTYLGTPYDTRFGEDLSGNHYIGILQPDPWNLALVESNLRFRGRAEFSEDTFTSFHSVDALHAHLTERSQCPWTIWKIVVHSTSTTVQRHKLWKGVEKAYPEWQLRCLITTAPKPVLVRNAPRISFREHFIQHVRAIHGDDDDVLAKAQTLCELFEKKR